MNELNDLLELLKTNKTVIEFKNLEQIIHKNVDLKDKLVNLFDLQKEMVQLKHLNKMNMYEIVKKEYEIKKKELEENPLVANFLELQNEVEYLLLEITKIIEAEININKWQK